MSNLSAEANLLLADWFRRVRQNQNIHYECATWYARWNYFLGIPAIILSTGVGTAVFASLELAATGEQRIIVGIVSLVAAILTSLQTFLRFSERGDQHRMAASEYGAIRRTLEYIKTFPPNEDEAIRSAFNDIRKQMDELSKVSPAVPSILKSHFAKHIHNGNGTDLFPTTGHMPK